MNFIKPIVIGAVTLLFSPFLLAQTKSQAVKTTAERLGFPPDSRLLIIHADDLGMAHSIDRATFEALENHWVTSASILVPCAWFPEVARWAEDHRDFDLGVHLTLNSEWENYKWRPLSKPGISSLTDSHGYLPSNAKFVKAHVVPDDAEREARAQIDTAIAAGIKVSHIDTHMQTFLRINRLFNIYWKLGQSYKIPIAMGKGSLLKDSRGSRRVVYGTEEVTVNSEMIPLDHVLLITKAPQSGWLQAYEQMLSAQPPGTYELVVHLGYNDEELQAITAHQSEWGAQWRQNDLDVVRSAEFREFLKDQHFVLVSWRDINKAMPIQ